MFSLFQESGVKLEQTILMYVLANVEHIIQKILQIAVNYVNQISLPTISAQDIKVSSAIAYLFEIYLNS